MAPISESKMQPSSKVSNKIPPSSSLSACRTYGEHVNLVGRYSVNQSTHAHVSKSFPQLSNLVIIWFV